MKLRDLALPEKCRWKINTSRAIYGVNRSIRARSGKKKELKSQPDSDDLIVKGGLKFPYTVFIR